MAMSSLTLIGMVCGLGISELILNLILYFGIAFLLSKFLLCDIILIGKTLCVCDCRTVCSQRIEDGWLQEFGLREIRLQ